MYNIKVVTSFSAAHNLREYKGKCEELHGHNWRIETVIQTEGLDKAGMVMDFTFVKVEVKKILEALDHKYLNQIEYFKTINPTSENIAKYIFDNLKPSVGALKSISVWESDNSCATYEG